MAERLSADQSIIVRTNLFYYLYLKANFRVTCIRDKVWYFYECNAPVIKIDFHLMNKSKASNLSFSLKKIIDLKFFVVSRHKNELIAGALHSIVT